MELVLDTVALSHCLEAVVVEILRLNTALLGAVGSGTPAVVVSSLHSHG